MIKSLKNLDLCRLLQQMKDPRKDDILDMYFEYEDLFEHALGSSHNHQAWEGGYGDHIAETLRINHIVYDSLDEFRPLPFTRDSAAICLFLHDIEKPFRYGPEKDSRVILWHERVNAEIENSMYSLFDFDSNDSTDHWEKIKWEIIDHLKDKFDFKLSDHEVNAITYTHGEGAHHNKHKRVASPLAAHVHHCDNISARIWFDEGRGIGVSY